MTRDDRLAEYERGFRRAGLPLLIEEFSASTDVFTGLYFAISMLTDDVYRREFLDELIGEMRDTFRARVEYLRLRKHPAPA